VRNLSQLICTALVVSFRVDMGKEVSQAKVFGTVGLVLAVCAITFFGPKQKKSGHNLFDTQRLTDIVC
jgi:hypothetical protein